MVGSFLLWQDAKLVIVFALCLFYSVSHLNAAAQGFVLLDDAFADGEVKVISKPEDEYFIYTRELGGEKWAIICNFEKDQDIELPFECEAPAVANLDRRTADGSYSPYECSVSRILG